MEKIEIRKTHNISAGAGAGKTTRLVDIITDLVAGKYPGAGKCAPERMILTTFTEAAAKEFREKATARLVEDGMVAESSALAAAHIGTIDSIAQSYIRRYWYLLGMSPELSPITEDESRRMVSESLESVVPAELLIFFREYAETFSIMKREGEGIDYDFWKDHVMSISEKVLHQGLKKKNLLDMKAKSVKLLERTFDPSVNAAVVRDFSIPALEYTAYCSDTDNFNGKSAAKAGRHADAIRAFLGIKAPTVKDIRALKEALDDSPFSLCKAAKGSDPTLEFKVLDAYSQAVEFIDSFVPAEASMISKCAGHIFDIVIDWAGKYAEDKKKAGVIDFSDMELKFLDLLDREEVKEDIRASVDYLFVDEFQDSNLIQVKIFSRLASLVQQSWFVGDQKQSIYGFRGSDSELISWFSDKFPKSVEDKAFFSGFKTDDDGLSSEILDKSHRSVPSLVELANRVFIPAFGTPYVRKNPDGTETVLYDKDVLPEEKVRLYPEGKTDPPFPTIHHVDLAGKNDDERNAALASAICGILNGDYEPLAGTSVVPSDIAVLTKSNASAVKIATALRDRKIPVTFVDTEFRNTPEVALVTAMLGLVSGKSVRKTQAELRSLIDSHDLKSVLTAVRDGEDTPHWGGLEEFARSLRSLSALGCVDALISRFNLYDFVSKWGNPDSRRANLDLVRSIAREFDSGCTSFCGASDIRSFLAYLKNYDPETKFNNAASGVKVLTYWKAKGLEWRAVFLTGLAGDIKEPGVSEIVGFKDGCLVPRIPDVPWSLECVMRDAEASRRRDVAVGKRIGEDRRLLYVGVTRAKELLFTVGNEGKALKGISSLCPTAALDIDRSGEEADIWGVGINSVCTRREADDSTWNLAVGKGTRASGAGFLQSEDSAPGHKEKYHSPSKWYDKAAISGTSARKAESFACLDIDRKGLEDNEFGDCIHHIYAVSTPETSVADVAMAERILSAYGIAAEGAAIKVAEGFRELCTFLEKEYGRAESIEHELPFTYTNPEGDVFNGNMDMVWNTADGSVIVDYKTTEGSEDSILSECVAKHASQVGIYRDALEAAERSVKACILFYPSAGLAVELLKR